MIIEDLLLEDVMTRTYKLLGALEIEEDGRPSPIMKYSKGCALLAYLIFNGQTTSREMIADLLWEASSTNHSLQNLRKLLSILRPLAPELIISRKQVSFQPDGDIAVDLYTLRTALDGDDVNKLDVGLALYRSELLDGFYLDDAPQFWEWQILAREHTRQRVWDGYHRLCTAYYANRAWLQGVRATRRWMQLEPLDESIHQWLMKFLAANGQKAAAMSQFERCRHLLAVELGVEPNPTTLSLLAQIQQTPDEFSAPLSPVAVISSKVQFPQVGVLAKPGALPPGSHISYLRNAVFTGRTDELHRLAELLLPVDQTDAGRLTRAAVVTGMGGLGKSQLSVEFAYRYGRFFPGGVYWLQFSDRESINEQVAAVGSERGMRLFSESDRLTLAKKVELVQHAWQEQIPRLLIFDNCADAMAAVDWLPVSGGCSVLLTSRQASWPKTLPVTTLPLATLSRSESVVFMQSLAEHLSGQEADMVAGEIGDWPLALHLAGSFLDRYQEIDPHMYVKQLRQQQLFHHTSLQGTHARYSPTGHELNVAHTFALSFDQIDARNPLDGIALQILARVTALAPNEPVPVALLLHTGGSADNSRGDISRLKAGINRLVALGFLNVVDTEHVVMHRLLVLFARNRLAEGKLSAEATSMIEETLLQHLELHRSATGSLLTLPFSPAHLRHVTEHAIAREDSSAVQFATLMGEHLIAIAEYAEARVYLKQAEAVAERHFGEKSLALAGVATQLGTLFQEMGQYKDAEPYYLTSLAIYLEKLGENHLETAASLNNIGASHLRIGPYAAAQPYFERALTIRERLLGTEHPLTLGVLNNLGVMHNFMGQPNQARFYFQKVLAVREQTLGPEHLLTATTLNNLGDLLSRNGEEAAGRPYLERAVAIRAQQLGKDHPLTLACRTNLGLLLSRLGEFEQAQTLLEQSLVAAQIKIGEYHPLTARIHNTLGVLFTQTAQYDAASDHLEQALRIREKVRGPIHPDTAYSLICLGEVCIANNEAMHAQTLLERALTILAQTVEPTAPEIARVRGLLNQLPET